MEVFSSSMKIRSFLHGSSRQPSRNHGLRAIVDSPDQSAQTIDNSEGSSALGGFVPLSAQLDPLFRPLPPAAAIRNSHNNEACLLTSIVELNRI